MKLNQILNEAENLLLELGDAPYPWHWTREPEGHYKSGEATFNVDGDDFNVQLYHSSDDDRVKIFWDKNSKFDGKDSENSAVRIIFTIMDIVNTYVPLVRPKYITFEANKGASGRDGRNKLSGLYTRIVKKFAGKLGYSSEFDEFSHETKFLLTRRDKKRRMG